MKFSCQTSKVLSKLNESLTIVVTHYRTPDLLRECLTRLEKFTSGATLIVLDSSPEEDALATIKDSFPSVTALRVVNHSMANLVNTGLKLAQTRYVLQMNADVMLEAETLPVMLEILARPGVGMVGPRCRTPGGGWQNQGPGYASNYALLDLLKRASLSVPWLSGCCQMVKREVLERVGGLDSSLRFYNEDTEWCWRIRKAGYSCQLLSASVLHIGGASTPADPKFTVEGFRGGYVLSQRYKPRLYQAAHRWGVRRYAAYKMRSSPTFGERQAYQEVLEMFRAERFEESPFGKTLDESNPQFLS